MGKDAGYTVFARRYRPVAFDEVAGQQHVWKTLRNAITENRVGHAYLFCGPRGVGKTTMAVLIKKDGTIAHINMGLIATARPIRPRQKAASGER